ncbi:hypothetical protein CYMTET_21722 [Cymbomonas tetramitiformis]|uniref:BAT2 N-terminal domain-containing protein n=1 Tax=Cymbomonas tetramitiformis TaxID=36881 RepID=A0AAE0L2P6_9CHLO|nr:hypothetical protein CYMTET_21722 [Cymbomonas tetramitiformis]
MSRNKGHNAPVADNSNNKFANSNLNAIFQKPQPQRLNSAAGQRHGMLLLGGAKTTRARAQPGGAKLAVPKPVNLPSIKKEHAGNDPATQLVPAGSTAGGWKTDEQQQQPPQASHPAKTQPPPSTALANEPKVAITAGSTWGSALSSRSPTPSEAAVPYASFGPGSRSFPGRGDTERLNPVEYPSLGSAAASQPRSNLTTAAGQPREESGRRNWDDDEREPLSAPSLRPQNADWYRREAERDRMEDERYTGRAPPVAPGGGPLVPPDTGHETPEDFGFGGPTRPGFFPDSRGLLSEPFERRDPLSGERDRFDRDVQREIFGRAMFEESSEREWRSSPAMEESSFPGSRMFAESARPPPLPPGPPPREREEKEKSEVDLEREAYKAEVASVFRQQEEEREQKRLAEEKLVEDELGPEIESTLHESRPEPDLPPTAAHPSPPHQPPPNSNSSPPHSPSPSPSEPEAETVAEDAESPTELPSKTGDQPQLVGKTRLAGKMMPRSERALAERKAYEDEEFRRKQSAAIKLKELEERIQRSKKEAEEKRQEQAAAEEALQEESPGAEVEVEVGKSSFGTVSDSRNASDASREEAKEIPPTLADADWAGNTSVALSPTTVQLSPSVPVVEDVLPPSHVLAGSHPAAEETILSESAALPPEPTPAWSGMPGLLEKPSAPGQAATSSWGVLPPTQGELSSSAAPMSEQPTLPNMAPGLGPLFTMGGEAIPPLVFTTGGILDQNALEEDNLPLGLTLGPVPIGLGSVRPPVGPPGTPAVSFMTMPPGMPKPHPSHPQAAGMLQDRSTWPGPAPVFGNGLNSMVPPMVTGMPAQQMLPVSMAPTLPGGPYGVGVPTAPGTFRSADQPSQICDVMQPPSAGHPVVAMPSLGQSITVPSIAADANGGAAPGSADSQALESGAKFTQGGALPSTNNKRGGLRRGREQEDKESSKRGGSAAGPAGLNKDRQQDRRAAKDEGSGEELGTGKGSKGGRGTGRAVPAVKEVTASAGSAVGKGEGAGGKGRKGEGAAKGGSGRKGKGSAEGLADGSIGATKGGRGEGKRLVYRIKQESGSAEDVDGEESTKLEYREGGQDDFIEVRSKKSVQSEKREQLKQTVPEAKKAGKGRREEALSDAEVAPAMNDKKGKPRAPRSTATDALLEQPAVVSDSTLAAMAAASAASAGFPGMSVRMAPPGVAQQQPDAVSKAVAHAWGGGPREYNSVPSLAQIQREELTKLTHTEIGGTVDMLPATLETPPDKKSGEQGKGSPGEGLPSGIFNNAGLPADGIGLPTDLSLGDLTHAPVRPPLPQGLPAHFAQHGHALSHGAFLPMAGFPQGPLGAFGPDPLGTGVLGGRSTDIPSGAWVQQQPTSSTQDSFYAAPQPFPSPFPPPQAQPFAHGSAGQFAPLNTATQFGQFGVNFASYLAGSGKQPDWKHTPSTVGPEPAFGQGLPEPPSMQHAPTPNDTNQWAAATFGPQCPAANEGSREVVPLVVAVVLPLDEEEEATWEMAQLAGVALVAGEEGRVLLVQICQARQSRCMFEKLSTAKEMFLEKRRLAKLQSSSLLKFGFKRNADPKA